MSKRLILKDFIVNCLLALVFIVLLLLLNHFFKWFNIDSIVNGQYCHGCAFAWFIVTPHKS